MRRSQAILIVPAIVAGLLLPVGASADPQPSHRPKCPRPLDRVEPPDGIRVTLELAESRVPVGEPIKMTVRVRNEGASPVPYSHGGQEFDFWVRDSARNFWLWSANKVFLQYLEEETLAPGEERSFSIRWMQKTCRTASDGPRQMLRPGSYWAKALWVSGPTESWHTSRIPFTITH